MRPYIGLMSGTSMDGIDAALVDMDSQQLLHGEVCPYSQELQALLVQTLKEAQNSLGFYSQLHTLIGREFANAVLSLLKKASISSKEVIAIGSHGQTLCHNPYAEVPYTVQFGCAHTIAEHTGIQVVADFRTRDLVLGGQGAPLAPLYHQAMFVGQEKPLALVNIGGIANMSYLSTEDEVMGFDIGPGNCLMDAWIFKHKNLAYDKNGDWALTGKAIESLLNDLLSDDYFHKKAPKSIGKEHFSLDWLEKFLSKAYAPEDVQATLLQLTAKTIAMSVQNLSEVPGQVLICGGGVHNQALLKALSALLPTQKVVSTAAFGVSPDFMEAMMMAWLAEKTIEGKMVNLQGITGASRPAILGAIYRISIYSKKY